MAKPSFAHRLFTHRVVMLFFRLLHIFVLVMQPKRSDTNLCPLVGQISAQAREREESARCWYCSRHSFNVKKCPQTAPIERRIGEQNFQPILREFWSIQQWISSRIICITYIFGWLVTQFIHFYHFRFFPCGSLTLWTSCRYSVFTIFSFHFER